MKQFLPKLKEVGQYLNFLKKCFSKPQFNHLTTYVNGLIVINKKSVKSISNASINGKDQSNTNRFITASDWNENKVEDRYLKKVNHLTNRRPVSLIIDDSTAKKTGKYIEGVQFHKDHSNNGYVFGHQIVTAMILCSNLLLPLFPKLYTKNSSSKIELARQYIEYACKKLFVKHVIIDSWYVCNELIQLCFNKGIILIGNIKSNRLIHLERGWTNIRNYKKRLTKNQFTPIIIDENTYQIHSKIVKLKGVGNVKLLISKQWLEDKKKWSKSFYIICTDTTKSEIYIIRNYTHRWNIETFHKDIKQNLGFGTCQIRLTKGITRHLILSALAYAILKMMMFFKKVSWTIGECIKYIQNKEFDDLIIEVIETENINERRIKAKHWFLSENAKV
jgi:SRSO17 transposase